MSNPNKTSPNFPSVIFFQFPENNLELNFENPCNLPMLRNLLRPKLAVSLNIIEKESMDGIIFRTTKILNRLILELMARGEMRIGGVLKWRLCDTQDHKLIIRDPKSGKEQVFKITLITN